MVDPDVIGDRATEVWARVYMPDPLPNAANPLLVFLHGNHGTCGTCVDGTAPNPTTGQCAPGVARSDSSSQYTSTGTCPPNFVVTPNHNGYGYIADRLASWGYVVVSINVNRGINAAAGIAGDAGLNLTRGKMVLKHLKLLSRWNRGLDPTPGSLGVDLTGKLDFGNLALMGHSRGGEGQRAAYNQYRDAGSHWQTDIPDPVTVIGIFEIGPVDGQTSRVLNADGTTWNVLLPMCDGDVSNLQGVMPFDRMMRNRVDSPWYSPKSTFTVWGTNHNYYNTEWQISDSSGCTGHSPIFTPGASVGSTMQQQVGRAGVMGFMRSTLPLALDDFNFTQIFNPQYGLPAVITSLTRVDRGYTDSPILDITVVFENWDMATGINTWGAPNTSNGLAQYTHGSVPNHAGIQRAALVQWSSAGDTVWLQTNWSLDGDGGLDISFAKTLDIRLSRQSSALNPSGATNFSVALVRTDGSRTTAVPISNYTNLVGPVGGPGGLHPILQTARIPTRDFSSDLSRVQGVRFTFNGTASGAINIGNVWLSAFSGSPPSGAAADAGRFDPSSDFAGGTIVYDGSNSVNTLEVRSVSDSPALNHGAGVEIVVSSNRDFPIEDELPVLTGGGREFVLSRYADSDTKTLIFTLTPDEYRGLKSGDDIVVQYGRGDQPMKQWIIGTLR